MEVRSDISNRWLERFWGTKITLLDSTAHSHGVEDLPSKGDL